MATVPLALMASAFIVVVGLLIPVIMTGAAAITAFLFMK